MKPAYAGVDLGGTNLRGVVADYSGQIIIEQAVPVGLDREPHSIVVRMGDLVGQLSNRAAEKGYSVLAAGFGIAGWYNNTTGIMTNSPNLGWRNVPLKQMVASTVSIPFFIFNDLSAVTYAEYKLGAGKGSTNMLCVFVGTGVGSGMVLNGMIFEGTEGYAGELGHIPIFPVETGEKCSCGGCGHLEAYTGGFGIECRVKGRFAIQPDQFPGMDELTGGDPHQITAATVTEGARRGWKWALDVLDEAATYLAMGLSTALCVLNPDTVILGGGVMEGSEIYREMTLQRLHKYALPMTVENVAIRKPELGSKAGIVGAAILARDHLL